MKNTDVIVVPLDLYNCMLTVLAREGKLHEKLVKDATKLLEDYTRRLMPLGDRVKEMAEAEDPLIELARELRELTDARDAVKEYGTGLYKDIEALSISIIPEMMADLEVVNVRYEGIGRLQVKQDAWVSVLAANREAVKQWLIESGNEPLLKTDFNANTLKATIKGYVKDGIEFPQELIKYEPYEKATVVKV